LKLQQRRLARFVPVLRRLSEKTEDSNSELAAAIITRLARPIAIGGPGSATSQVTTISIAKEIDRETRDADEKKEWARYRVALERRIAWERKTGDSRGRLVWHLVRVEDAAFRDVESAERRIVGSSA
jgi:hypothetical protein